ncbi:helix-turn-helix domain-containing protein [Muriventricola aceti]|uniref:helix-turn-helix domain-containing protein n=1 Tax=Muriventricola aceti TaxID=2981773 RepID=UPI00293E9491|nr:helix-turn-helix domain-containing protein [Muriventricola aceti]
MIQYSPLWKTMSDKRVTTYTLREKHGMSHATVQRLQRNMHVSTFTLAPVCEKLSVFS